MSIRLFEGENHAKLYAKYRPTYPESVYSEIKKFCESPEGSGSDVALDVGCGNGQSTFPLTTSFKTVLGRDISEKQISEAKSHGHNIEFSVGPAEDLSFLEDSTVDLVTSAQAIHWMDRPKFYQEVTRVLRPGGALVVYGYGNAVLDRTEANEVVWQFYENTLDGYWANERGHIEDSFARIELPFKGWYRLTIHLKLSSGSGKLSKLDTLSIDRTWDVDSLVGYLSSWSAWQTFLKSNPNSSALADVGKKLKSIYKDMGTKEVTSVAVTWPIFMLFGRKPMV